MHMAIQYTDTDTMFLPMYIYLVKQLSWLVHMIITQASKMTVTVQCIPHRQNMLLIVLSMYTNVS